MADVDSLLLSNSLKSIYTSFVLKKGLWFITCLPIGIHNENQYMYHFKKKLPAVHIHSSSFHLFSDFRLTLRHLRARRNIYGRTHGRPLNLTFQRGQTCFSSQIYSLVILIQWKSRIVPEIWICMSKITISSSFTFFRFRCEKNI